MDKKTLTTIFEELKTPNTKEDEFFNLLHVAQKFNDASGKGTRGIVIKKTYEPYCKFVQGGKGFAGIIAPKLEALIYSTIHFGNKNGTSWKNRNEAHGNIYNVSKEKDTWHRPVTIEELTFLGIKNAKYGRFYCNKKVEKVESLNQLYVQYYPVVEGQIGYNVKVVYFMNGAQTNAPNKDFYKVSPPRNNQDQYTLLSLDRFVEVTRIKN